MKVVVLTLQRGVAWGHIPSGLSRDSVVVVKLSCGLVDVLSEVVCRLQSRSIWVLARGIADLQLRGGFGRIVLQIKSYSYGKMHVLTLV